MTQYPESGVKLVVDTKEAASAVSDLMSQLDELQGATYTASLDVEVDTADAQAAIDDLPLDGETVDFTVNADVTGTEDLPVDGETVDTNVNVEETDTAKETLGALNTLKNLKVLETVWNITGTAVDIFRQFGGQVLQPMLDLDDAVARVNSQTADGIPNARELIKGIFYDDLGESIGQVAELATKAYQIKAPVDEATRAALIFTHTFQDQNPQQVLDTLNQMVVNKLTPDFKTAGDTLVTAFQNGANRGGDLLQALNDNANAIHNMGLTGPEALSFIKTGLDNGFNSAQQVIGALEKIKQNVTNAAGNQTSDVTKTLNLLGIANPAETGEAWSADFFKKVIEGIKNQPGLSDSEKEVLFTNLIGGKQGGKTFSAFLAMSPDDADTIFANVGGAAERAAEEADNSLTGAFNDFKLAVEKAVEDWLSSSAIDLPGKIAKLKEGLQNALDTLAKGGSLSEALTVALKPIGFDDEFQGLESALGNFIIALLQIVASIQDFAGHGEEAQGTRNVVTKLATKQLDFDLKIANPEDLQLAISTAASRGLSDKDIATEISGVIQGLIKTGTKDSLAQAQAIIDTLKTPVDQNKLPTLASGAPMNVEPVVSDEALDNLQGQIDTAMAKVPPPDKVDAWQESLDTFATSVDQVKTSGETATSSVDKVAKSTSDLGKNAGIVYPKTDQTADSLATVSTQADNATSSLTGFGNQLDVIAGKLQSALGAADAVAQQKNQQGAAVNPDQTSGPHAAGGQFAGTALVGEKGAEIVSSNRGVAVLNNMTTENILAALQNFIPGASSVGKSGNTYIANNNNIVNSQAEADAVGYSTARVLRGMG